MGEEGRLPPSVLQNMFLECFLIIYIAKIVIESSRRGEGGSPRSTLLLLNILAIVFRVVKNLDHK